MRSALCPSSLHFHDLASHFLSLPAGDRFLRFGWVATDVEIVAYVEKLLPSIGSVFVVLEPAPDVSGALHLEFAGCGADLGLSVSPWARGKGIGFAGNITLADHRPRCGWSKATVHDFAVDEVCEWASA
jgi:hypothetical protein